MRRFRVLARRNCVEAVSMSLLRFSKDTSVHAESSNKYFFVCIKTRFGISKRQ